MSVDCKWGRQPRPWPLDFSMLKNVICHTDLPWLKISEITKKKKKNNPYVSEIPL